ncbi:MAG: D-glycero-beta-D-manno-heptose-7-phosphate kinase [Alphaproteobacteria bacterium]|nr:D-glycero-beta-D-manno-heptose-7-phosphate kinase [Alphaproteobacteria bacterium]
MESALLVALETVAAPRVLCIGDVMLDRFVYGAVERISPEAPIPVLHVNKETACLGGAGNVLRNLQALGGEAEFIAVIGDDAQGRDLTAQMAAMQGVTPSLLADAARPTTVKTRYVSDGQQLLRVDYEKAGTLSADVEKQIIARLPRAIAAAAVVVLSDYAKGVLSDKVVRAAIDEAAKQKKPVLVDPKGRDYTRYRGASYLTPNRKELSEVSGRKIESVADAENAARDLIASCDLQGVVAKLGGDGICLVRKDMPALHFHIPAREVYDVSGAGDTVIATFALMLAGGQDAAVAAELANLAGSVVVGKVGTAVVTRDELAHELLHQQSGTDQIKILTRAQAEIFAERWRKQGFKVGFTNGCFDLLHPGHVSLLRQARAACDKLFVGLNSDASVKRLKGETRPIQAQTARAAVLASLADVDHVVIFDEDTPIELIKAIKPAALIKGADYTVDTVVGADLVQGWGGKVVLANLVDGQSTTGIVKRMAGS